MVPSNAPRQQRNLVMNLLRLTIVEPRGAISFVTHGEALPALMRACTTNPRDLDELLERSEPYYVGLRERVVNGLVMFDERNVPGEYGFIHGVLEAAKPDETPVFRVVDDETREASLRPVKAGCVVINLVARRVITLQNGYMPITRNGRGEIFDGERATGATFVYRLPQTWSLVP